MVGRTREGAGGAPGAGLLASVGLPFEALGLLRRERRLWGPAGFPLLLSLLAVGGALAGVLGHADAIRAAVLEVLPRVEAGAWYTWAWVGPAKAGLWVAGHALFLMAAALALVAAFAVANLLAAPFHDLLARRVEELETGQAVDAVGEGLRATLRDALRSLREEARRLLFFALVFGGLFAIFWLVPGGQVVAPPAMTLFAILFLPLEYASYALDRRQLSFRDKRDWLKRHRAATLGYGGAAFVLCALPLLNLVAMPVLVVGGTLLALRNPPEPPGAAG